MFREKIAFVSSYGQKQKLEIGAVTGEGSRSRGSFRTSHSSSQQQPSERSMLQPARYA
ncbi:hypothetical protein BGZ46_002168 [Entomortierella lignicola]|nr:hypothetical protein BGZ46_002168 [Entomortierella lignicola]